MGIMDGCRKSSPRESSVDDTKTFFHGPVLTPGLAAHSLLVDRDDVTGGNLWRYAHLPIGLLTARPAWGPCAMESSVKTQQCIRQLACPFEVASLEMTASRVGSHGPRLNIPK